MGILNLEGVNFITIIVSVLGLPLTIYRILIAQLILGKETGRAETASMGGLQRALGRVRYPEEHPLLYK